MSAGFPQITVRAEKPRTSSFLQLMQTAGAGFVLFAILLLTTSCGMAGQAQNTAHSNQTVRHILLSASLPTAKVQAFFQAQVEATGGIPPYQFASSGVLPPGLALNADSGIISGTPRLAGTYDFTVEATDLHQDQGGKQFTVAVSRAGSQITLSVSPATITIPSGNAQQFTASVSNTSNTAVTWSADVGSISSNGAYTAPAVTSTTVATVKATSAADSSVTDTAAVTITATESTPLVVNTKSIPSVADGSAYSTTLSAAGGKTPYRWGFVSGTLPGGIVLDNSGVLSGTTNQSGQFSFTVQVADSSSPAQTARATLSLAASTASHVKINALFPPMGPGNSTWNGFNTYVLTSPYLDGVNPGLDWNTVETSQGVYDFSKFDASLQHFYDAGKTVNIIVRPVSNGGSNSFTPSYVFTSQWASSVGAPPQTVVTCKGYPGNGQLNSGFPVVYQLPFKVAYKKFVAAVLAHYANNPHIGYIRVGLAVGGEVFPWCSSVIPGFSQSTWLSYIDEMNAYEKSLTPTMQLMAALNQVYFHGSWDQSYASAEATNAVANGQGIGSQGWQEADIAAFKAGLPCASDWCNLFDQYAGLVPLELQQAGQSIANGGITTGSMADIIPFAVAHHATVFEVYVKDLLTAFDPNWPSYTVYGSGYRQALIAAHGQ